MSLLWVERLISIAVVLQTLESFAVAPWPWAIVEGETARSLRPFLKHYRVLLAIRLIAALATLVGAPEFLSLSLYAQLFTTWLIAVRWRGTFNGGSDCMTFQILAACFVASIFNGHAQVQTAALFYIGAQVLLSYFVAGVAKLREPEWRNGHSLAQFLGRSRPLRLLSWLTIGFECAAPLCLLSPAICAAYLATALAFHVLNFYFFGLNRFVFVWAAGYPALLITTIALHARH